jgi:predicted phage tail protein
MTGVKSHRFDVNSLADIKDALSVLFPKIRRYIKQISAGTLRENLSLVTPEGTLLTRKEYYIDRITTKELTLVPVIAGAGGKTLGIILGIAMIATAIFFPPAGAAFGSAAWAGTTIAGTAGSLFSITAGGLLKMGLGLVLSGLMQMMMQPPSPKGPSDSSQRRNNDMFDAFDNTTDPNTSIPLIYGMPRVGGQLLSGYVETITHGQSDVISVTDIVYKRTEIDYKVPTDPPAEETPVYEDNFGGSSSGGIREDNS